MSDEIKIPDWITREPRRKALRGPRVDPLIDLSDPTAPVRKKDVYLDGIVAHAEKILADAGFTDLTVSQAQEKTLIATLAYLYNEIVQGGLSNEQAIKLANAIASKVGTAVGGVNFNAPIIFGIPEPQVITSLRALEQPQLLEAMDIIDGRSLEILDN